ncbi:MAG: hypothetical protein KGJ82_11270 [Nitrospirota bacterium]|nr:hypothetical protein [Nitrospirota bacterium]
MNDAESYQEVKATGTTHGLGTLKRAVKALGNRAVDGRSTLAKELARECRELVNALGGEAEVSPQEKALIQMIAQKRIRRKIAAQWCLLNRDRLFNRKKMKMAPIALELEQLEESEARLLDKLGLKRRAKPVKGLTALLAEPSHGAAAETQHDDQHPGNGTSQQAV